MSLRRKLALGAAVVAGAAVVVALLVLAGKMRSAELPAAPSLNVPATFKTLRDSPGHVAHIHKAKVACGECHDLDRHGFEIPDEDLCARCHDKENDHRVAAIHAVSPLGNAVVDCQACHTFTLDSSIKADNCLRCHDREQGEAKTIVTHKEAVCTDCHSPHQVPSLTPLACAECHEDRTEVRHGGKKVGAMLCLDCHGVHDQKAEADRRCDTCHQSIAATAVFAGHDACVGCHLPHDFTAATAQTCVSCHKDQKALASTQVAKHRACDSCHKNHEQRGPTEAACLGCHKKKIKVQGHPAEGPGKTCLGCHPAHPSGAAALVSVVGCPTCHQSAATTTSFHAATTACVDCHKPHDFAVSRDDSKWCGGCHKEQKRLTERAMLKGHEKCVGCHVQAPHQPKDTAKECVSCHASVRDTAPKGHKDCATCHVSHSGDLIKDFACGSCHEQQKDSKHASVQGGCVSCHRPHGPRGRSEPPNCETCHKPATLPGLHAVAEHRQCTTCHLVHEDKPKSTRATCATAACHRDIKGTPIASHEPSAAVCSGCHVFGAIGRSN